MRICTIRRGMIGSLMTLLLLGTGLMFQYSSALAGPSISGLWSPSHPDQNTWYSNSSPFFSWSPSGSGYSYDFDQNPTTVPDDTEDTSSPYASFPGIADGTWYFHVKAFFAPSGGWGVPAHFRVQIDTTGPAVTGLASPTHPDENTAYADHNPSFSWNSSTVGLLGSCCSVAGGGKGVAVSGNYAYMADGISGLKIIDISNPANPQSVGSLDTPGSGEGVAVSGNYAYVADGSSGLRVINVSNPSSPQEVGSWATAPRSSKNVAISGSYAYVADGANGLQIIDITDPTFPESQGAINPGNVWSVAISGNYAYLASWYSGLKIVDITDPAAPILKGTVTAYTIGSVGVAVDGNYAYVADTANGLMVIDITSKTSPVHISSLKPPGTATSVAVSGNYAYLADGTGGLHVIDISNPASPVLKGTYDTAHTASGVAVTGNYAYVADGSNGGLQILRFTPSSFSYVLDQIPGTDPDTTIDGTSVAALYTGIADGSWYFHVKAVDDLGNWGAPVHRKIQIFSDSIAPATSATGPSGWQTVAFNVDLSCSDNLGGSGCYRTFYKIDDSTEYIGNTVPIIQEGDHSIEFYSTDIAGNTEAPHKFTTAKLDAIAPTITNIVPSGTVTGYQQTIEADLGPELTSGSGVDRVSAAVYLDGSTTALTGCTTTPPTHISCPKDFPDGGSHTISVTVNDVAGNTGSGSGSFEIPRRDYWWTWYDNLSAGSQNWVLMANPSSAAQSLTYQLSIGGNPMALSGWNNGLTAPGASLTPQYPGVRNGPVNAASLTGDKGIVSQRVLWAGNSLEEVVGTEAGKLSSHFYWPWYDDLTPGYTNYVMVANPGSTTVWYQISIAGVPVTGAGSSGSISPGQSAFWRDGSKQGGPVEVEACLNPFEPDDSCIISADVMASQRILSNGDTAFNELPGTPAGDRSDHYLWTWYDNIGAGGNNLILIGNPVDGPADLYYTTKVGTNPVSSCSASVPRNTTAAWSEAGLRDGPVELTTYSDASCTTLAPQAVATQRIIWGPSLEEVPGYPSTALASTYHWTWYDELSPGSQNWVLIANPNDAPVTYSVKVAGTEKEGGTIPAHGNVTPHFPNFMDGPVEVTSTGGSVMASQRVLWNGFFNETLGTVLE